MAKTRIKFIWGGAKQQPGDWHLGLWGNYERDPGSRIGDRAISVRGLLCWFGGLMLAGYLAGATALFVWFERQPMNMISYADTLLLPLRWEHVRELRGRMMIEAGLADFRAKKWAEGQMKLRVGLARAPHDTRGRLALAQFYVLANRRPSALALLKENLKFGYPGRPYLGSMFALARQSDDEDAIVEACDQFLPTETEDRNWLLAQKTQALLAAGRPAEVLKLAEAEGARATVTLKEAHAIALLDLGRADDAIAFLEAWRKNAGGEERRILRLLVRADRDAHRFEAMDAAWEAFRALGPADPRTYVYGVVQKALAGRSDAANAALDDYFFRFAGAPNNLALVTVALAEARQPELVQRCVNEAALHGFPAKRFKAAQLEVQIATGDWRGATRSLAELKGMTKNPGAAESFGLEWMERLLAVASRPAEAPQAALLEMLQRRPVPLKMFQQSAEVLLQAKRYDAARSVLELAKRGFPDSHRLAEVGARIDAAAPAKVAAPVVLAAKTDKAPLEREFFADLDAAEKAGRWTEAAAAIRGVRTSKPAWLERREADVLDRQMRVAMHTGDALELLGAAKLFLDGTNERGSRVVELARELAASGDRTNAEFLLAEVFRKLPDFPPATRLKREWHPPPKPEKKETAAKKAAEMPAK